ncbi:MAG: hypothetical protein SH807_03525 [Blastochloris sp.]|nr:hypothetical protein [Blastochloris sp.]
MDSVRGKNTLIAEGQHFGPKLMVCPLNESNKEGVNSVTLKRLVLL